MKKPFNNELENKKYIDLYNTTLNNLNNMMLSTDIDVMKYIEIIVSCLLLELNKKFPEPNYSVYLTYRIKSSKSNISKLEDYIKRATESNTSVSIKEILDIFGLRIIVEKIPHNITLDPNNPEYETLKMLDLERKENIQLSQKYHEFEFKINEKNCTSYEYYNQCKELLQNTLNMFESETSYSKDYALDLKTKYTKLIEDCDKKISILTALGDYSSQIELDPNINFKELLENFDSRIDSRLGLKLYSSSLPEIISNSERLQSLGISIDPNPSRMKHKREKSGYVADFYGLCSNVLNIPIELQVMYANEHKESIIGYSAHSKMPGKQANFMETPSAYTNRNMQLLNNIGTSTYISNKELTLINILCDTRKNNKDKINNFSELLKHIATCKSVVFDNNSPTGIKIDSNYLKSLNDFCSLSPEESKELRLKLYNNGCKIYDAWAKNISANHATTRLDKDSFAQNRVKTHYDDSYECLSHSIREQTEDQNSTSIDSVYYLKNIYRNQNDLLKNSGLMASESSVIDFEIDEYIENILPKLIEKIHTKKASNSYEIVER